MLFVNLVVLKIKRSEAVFVLGFQSFMSCSDKAQPLCSLQSAPVNRLCSVFSRRFPERHQLKAEVAAAAGVSVSQAVLLSLHTQLHSDNMLKAVILIGGPQKGEDVALSS